MLARRVLMFFLEESSKRAESVRNKTLQLTTWLDDMLVTLLLGTPMYKDGGNPSQVASDSNLVLYLKIVCAKL